MGLLPLHHLTAPLAPLLAHGMLLLRRRVLPPADELRAARVLRVALVLPRRRLLERARPRRELADLLEARARERVLPLAAGRRLLLLLVLLMLLLVLLLV